MAFILKNAWVQINSVDLSDHVAAVGIDLSRRLQDATSVGDAAHRWTPGLRDDSFMLALRQDFAATEVDQTLWPLFSGGSEFFVEVAADGTAISGTNPKYSGVCLLVPYPPIAGDVGDVLNTIVELAVQGGISRSTTAGWGAAAWGSTPWGG